MARKTSDSPRRIYRRSETLIVLFEGRRYAMKEGVTSLDPNGLVTCVPVASDGGRARIELTQKLKGKPAVKEVWRTLKV